MSTARSEKNRLLTITILILILSALPVQARLSPGLERLSIDGATATDSLVEVIVFLENQPSFQQVARINADKNIARALRIRSVVRSLKSFKPPYAHRIRQLLDTCSATPVKYNWIAPSFTARLPVARLESLAALEGVRLVVENAPLIHVEPVSTVLAEPTAPPVSYELQLVNVPALWSRGLKGKGRLVCSFDTGVEQSHPALAAKWRGNHAPLSASWFSKVSPDTLPSDRSGHGT
ncbi:MAG: hypothetical protein AB1744_09160, partial [Candidatus Zixiibacteriota bacterium]